MQGTAHALEFTRMGETALVTFRGNRVPCLMLGEVLGVASCEIAAREPTLVMQAHLCTLPRHSGPRAALCEALLLANTRLADSDRLGIEPAENAAVYQRVVDIDIDADALGHELWDLIDAAEQFRHGLGHD